MLGMALLGLAIIMIAGLLLPAKWSARAQVVIEAPAEIVFPYVSRLPNWEKWAVWFAHDPDMQVTYGGPEEGEGAWYDWSGDATVGSGTLRIRHLEPGRGIGLALEMQEGRFTAEGSIETSANAHGTEVTWELHGGLGVDPFARLNRGGLEQVVKGTLGDSLDRLKQVVEAASAAP